MRLKECLSIHLRMTRELFKISPVYAAERLVFTIFSGAIQIFGMSFYKYIIDLIVYRQGSLREAVPLLFIYFAVGFIYNLISSWDRFIFCPKHQGFIRTHYTKSSFRESAKRKTELFHSDEYVDLLYNAVYHDGNYLYLSWDSVTWLIYSVIRLIFFINVFVSLHPVLLVLLALRTAKDIFFRHNSNRLDYLMYRQRMNYNSSFQHIRNVFYLKQYARERRVYPIGALFIDKYREDLQKCWNEQWKNWKKSRLNAAVSGILDSAVYLPLLGILMYGLAGGFLTLGGFNLVLSNYGDAYNDLKEVVMFFPNMYSSAKYMKDIFTVLDSEELTCPKTGSGPRPRAVLENVSFSYNGEHDVLKNLSLDLALDQKIAIVGENGSGKSTFLKLLLGLYTPTGGKIRYTSGDSAVTDTSQLFGSMLQDFHTFVLTLSENITLKEELTEEDVLRRDEAIRFSGLEDKVNSLENGVDTPLTDEFTELGTELSGGEMQKLAIARAYMADRPVLVLDEPSSNLDPVSENRLIDRINRLTEKKGVILVTHNLSYAKNVDLVIVFHDGQIVESGSPNQLIEQGGPFARMVSEQANATS